MFDAFIIVIVLVAWYVGTTVLRSEIGGWGSLAKEYRCLEPFNGISWKRESARLRGVTFYRGYLTVGADSQGLFLSVHPFYRLAHPPLFIPWREISISRRKIIWIKQVTFRLGHELRIPLTMGEGLAQRLQTAAGSSWPT